MLTLSLYIFALCIIAATFILTPFAKFPSFWIVTPWIVVFLPVGLGVLSYWNPEIGFGVLLFVIGQLLAVGAGYAFSTRLTRHSVSFNKEITKTTHALRQDEFANVSKTLDLITIIGCVGSVLFIIDAYFLSGFAVHSSAVDMRITYIEADTTLLGRIAPLMAWGGYVSLLALFWYGPEILKRRAKYYFFAVLLLSTFSMLSAGRQVIFQILLFSLTAWAITRQPTRRKNINLPALFRRSVFIFVLAAFAWNMITLTGDRSSNEIADTSWYLLQIFGADLSPDVEEVFSRLSASMKVNAIGVLMYFSSQLSTLSAFLSSSAQETWGIGFGGMQFPWMYRRVDIVGLSSLSDIMELRRNYLSSNGYMSVSWSTAFGTFLNDFGFLGSFIYSFAVGFFGGHIYRKFIQRPHFYSFCLLAASYVYLFYLILIPASSDTLFFFFVTVLLILEYKFAKYVRRQNI